MNHIQLRSLIIQPTLQTTSLYSRNVEELLVAIAAHESHLGEWIAQLGGPALGIYQMEPATLHDLRSHSSLFKLASMDEFKPRILTHEQALTGCLQYATITARYQLLRFSEPLPVYTDLQGLAVYWKNHWNTSSGSGNSIQFMDDYRRYVIGGVAK